MFNYPELINFYNSPIRNISVVACRVYDKDNNQTNILRNDDRLKEFTIERIGEGKFFGYGVCTKLNVHILNYDDSISITTDNYLRIRISFRDSENNIQYLVFMPKLYVTETHKDEKTGELSITAYDLIYLSEKKYVGDLELTPPYTINQFATACSTLLGASDIVGTDTAEFETLYENGANFEGTETIREALNAIAEATQTIYYVNNLNKLVFKRLDISGEPVFTIDKEKYIELESGDNRRLSAICHATELGDNVSVSLDITGTTQYVRDNPFWELRDDIDTLLANALDAVGGLTINQFSCEWRGNPAIEIGDKIGLEKKDGTIATSFLLNDTIHYDGSLSQFTEWDYEDSDETESNPANLGDALKQTFARVDKVNKQIDLVVSKTEENAELLTNLQLTTDNITASVEEITSNVNESLNSVNNDITELSNKVSATMTSEDVQIQIDSAMSNGVNKVVTSTGFTFNEEGLTVSKSGSEMTTTITEDGMIVYKDEEAVLTANNIGVNATNLHATTYLIIGNNSRIEDYGDSRSGIFWIGG